MAKSYENISTETARSLKLIMTDVDGTITSTSKLDGRFSGDVMRSFRLLEEQGIIVGLVSGRNMNDLDGYAEKFNISGPLIGENGAVARIRKGGGLIDLGVSQKPAIEALEKLERLFPDAIQAGEWNKSRTMDLIIKVTGVSSEEIQRHLDNADLLDSGYVFHLIQKGVSKANTLDQILKKMKDSFSADTTMVFGDAPTDLSLFQAFPNSVLVINPELTEETRQMLMREARYVSHACCGEGFSEVVRHILAVRNGKLF